MGGGSMGGSGNLGPNPWASNASIAPGMQPLGMMTGNPNMMNQMARGPQGVFPTGYTEDFSRMPAPMMRGPPQVWDQMPGIPGEVVVGERIDAPQFVGQRVVGQEWVYGVKPYVTMEKVVEVPQTIVKEHTRMVPKPEIVERIIEVPKIGYNERTRKGPSKTYFVENIEEVNRGVVTETLQHHVPKTEYQERLIEIPKIEHRQVIVYEDRVEYREVPVDKIVEVPEIEYRIRDVERFVPQTYVQEYFVDRYTEVPVQQLQEVERVEFVPVVNPVPNYRAVGIPVPTPVGAPQGVPVPMPMPIGSGQFNTMGMQSMNMGGMMPPQSMNMGGMPQSMNMMNTAPMMPMMNTGPMQPMNSMGVGNAYANYDW